MTPDKLIWTSIEDDLAGKMAKAIVAAGREPIEVVSPSGVDTKFEQAGYGPGYRYFTHRL